MIATAVSVTPAAQAYNCDGPNDPVCVAVGTACLVAEKAKLGEWCDLG